MRLATLILRRQAFLAVGAVSYAAVFALFLIFERPGLGIGHGFYLAVILVSLAGDPIVGLGAGLLATVLYATGIWINPHISPATIPTLGWMTTGLVLVGVPLALVGAGVWIPVALVCLASLGVGNVLIDVCGYSILVRSVRDDVLARVLGVLETTWAAAVGLLLVPATGSEMGRFALQAS